MARLMATAPLASALLGLLVASALAVSRAASFVPCPSDYFVSVSISTANASSFFNDGTLTFDNADSPDACINLAQQNGCEGDINRFYVYSEAGFSAVKGRKLGNCLYGTKCAAKGLPSGPTPAVTGIIDPPSQCSLDFIPCPYGEGVRSIGLNLTYNSDGSNFAPFPTYANVSDAVGCRDFASSVFCNSFPFTRQAALKSAAKSHKSALRTTHRGQALAPAPGYANYQSFFVYLPTENFYYTNFDGDKPAILGNCIAASSCGSLAPGDTPALFGNVIGGGLCPPQPPYPPNPSPPPPLKLAACPTGTAWKTVYIDAYNALAGFKRGAPYQYAFAASAQECYQAALNDTCAGNPVDFFMYTLTPLNFFGFSYSNCAWGTCQGLALGSTLMKVGRVGLSQCLAPSGPTAPAPPRPRLCAAATKYFRQCSCPVANASCKKSPRCRNRWVCTCQSGSPVLDPETGLLKSCVP